MRPTIPGAVTRVKTALPEFEANPSACLDSSVIATRRTRLWFRDSIGGVKGMNVIAGVRAFGERWWEMVIPAREMSMSSGSGVPRAGGEILLKCRRYRRIESVWSEFM